MKASSLIEFDSNTAFDNEKYIKNYITKYNNTSFIYNNKIDTSLYTDDFKKRFKDDNPSRYIWFEYDIDSVPKNILRDQFIEFELVDDFKHMVITNCGFVVFTIINTENNEVIKSVYDLFEEYDTERETSWKEIIPDFSFFNDYNHISTPLNCRRIYFKDGVVDLNKVKRYQDGNIMYANINADAIYVYEPGKIDKSYLPTDDGFFKINMNNNDNVGDAVNYIRLINKDNKDDSFKAKLWFKAKPQYQIRVFNSDGTENHEYPVVTYDNYTNKQYGIYIYCNLVEDENNNKCRIIHESNIYNIDFTTMPFTTDYIYLYDRGQHATTGEGNNSFTGFIEVC